MRWRTCAFWHGGGPQQRKSLLDGHDAPTIVYWPHMLLQAIKASGATYLEAPVSGSKQPAEKGQLIFLCGGDKELYEKATPLLKVMGKAQFFLGEVCATYFICKPDTDGNMCR